MSLINQIVEGIRDLEPLPVSAQRLLAASLDEDLDLRDVVRIVELDEALTANVLRVANGSSRRGREQICDLRMAVVRLGVQTLAKIAMEGVVKHLSFDAPLYALDEHELWRHSAAASLAAQRIREMVTTVEVPPTAPTAALVHDLGKLIVVRFVEADMSQLLELCDRENMSYVEAEREIIGWDHTQVGGEVARAWNLPADLRDVIERHHEVSTDKVSPLVDTVVVANFVCRTIGIGLGAAGLNVKMDTGAFGRLGLSNDDVEILCSETAIAMDQLADSIG